MNQTDLKQIEKIVEKSLANTASKDDLKRFATKDDLKNFARKADLKDLATKKDLEKMGEQVTEDLANLMREFVVSIDEKKADKIAVEHVKERLEKLERLVP